MSADRDVPREEGHRVYDELAVGWALHGLEPQDEAMFARHLPGCERCARTVAETFEVMADLATGLPEDEPSEQLPDRLRAATWETEQAGGVGAHRPAPVVPLPQPRPRRRWRTVLAAAAAAVIVGLGAATGVLGVSLQHARTDAARQQQIVEALLGQGPATMAPMTAPSGRQVATVVARDGRVDVVSDGLPANDRQASTYVLWGLGHGSPVALGTFDVSAERPELHAIGPVQAASGGFSAYGISLEPGRQAPPAPTDVVGTGQQPS